jgi:competence protein ComEC
VKFFLVFAIVFFRLKPAATPAYENKWVVWNIGQGQWVTHILPDSCIHFDMGGEPGSFARVRRKLILNCGLKKNFLLLSHWDFDHYFNVSYSARVLPALCWQYRPSFGVTKASVQKVLSLNIPACSAYLKLKSWIPGLNLSSTNESSAVFLDENVLLPGDSPLKQESLWAPELRGLNLTKVLILSHHGSRTSTGAELLNALPDLKWAVASARWAKYHHPHTQTLQRLYSKNIPVLRTEDWGNIWFEIF